MDEIEELDGYNETVDPMFHTAAIVVPNSQVQQFRARLTALRLVGRIKTFSEEPLRHLWRRETKFLITFTDINDVFEVIVTKELPEVSEV